ncbi:MULTISPECIES: hypothetical protein [Enterobacter]|nr:MULTISPECIES: hypothetical protein [Enterobacter]AUM05031.1 hypothetical protein B7P19_18140 [Enterobacter sp. Crenshaw]MDU7450905.1 hypothetical protein [Enterobacter sp.]UVH62589.1 hypothetical protein NWV12_17970 [Enterobacter sp. Crenshaw]WBN01221.1 hypothetical protein KHV90_17295 [Enterobacter asburiae]
MKTAMSALVVALMVSPLLHAAEAPVRIGLEQVKNPYYPNLHQQRVHVQSLTDSVTINDVVVNRGNCPIQKLPTVYAGSKPVALVPSTLTYGKEITVYIKGPCSVAEINVITSQGDWLMKY